MAFKLMSRNRLKSRFRQLDTLKFKAKTYRGTNFSHVSSLEVQDKNVNLFFKIIRQVGHTLLVFALSFTLAVSACVIRIVL